MPTGERETTRLLFVCTANSERSPTAEELFLTSRRYVAASAGIHRAAARVITQQLVDWADVIFVMSEAEDAHATILEKSFDLSGTRVVDLGIPDKYPRGSEKLKELLRVILGSYLRLGE
jgi:predicted protein tyrosine phosphatase